MIAHKLPHGSPEWLEARIARPTASRFKAIITAKKLEYSAGAKGYIAELLSEWATGFPVISGESQAMDRGTGMEEEAADWFSMHRDVDLDRGVFVERDDRRVAGSPDALVGDEGGAEIKVPLIQNHMKFLLYPGTLSDEYRAQCNGYIYLTGRKWWDVCSFSPVLPKVVERIERDDDFQAALHKHLTRFLSELEEGRQKLIELGVKPAPSFLRQTDPAAWEEAAASVRSSEEVVRGMYDPRPATEGEIGKLKILRAKADGLSVDEQMSLADTIRSGDAHAVLLWTRKLERANGRVPV